MELLETLGLKPVTRQRLLNLYQFVQQVKAKMVAFLWFPLDSWYSDLQGVRSLRSVQFMYFDKNSDTSINYILDMVALWEMMNPNASPGVDLQRKALFAVGRMQTESVDFKQNLAYIIPRIC